MLDLTLMTILCWTASGGRDCMKRRLEQTTHEPFRVCYYTTWARYRPGQASMHPHHVDPHLCSHVIIAFATVSTDGRLSMHSETDDAPIVEALVGLKTKNPKLKISIAIGGWNFGSEPFRKMISTEKNRATFVNSSLTFLKQYKLDGLDLDWEYPEAHDRQNFTMFIQDLAEAFIEESTVSSRPKYLLTAAVPGIKDKMSGYDVLSINKHFDFISIMTYDYHGPWDNKTGHNSPLFSHDGYNLAEGTQAWLDAGMPRNKIVVGLPTYGHAFKLQEASNPAVGSPTVGGIAGNYTRTPGFYAFYEVCELLNQEETVVLWDHFAAVPYCYNQNTWISFDDVRSLEKKVEWVIRQHYGGVMVWEMGMDDFSGAFCGGPENITYPLLKSINAAISSTKSPSSTPRAKEPSFRYSKKRIEDLNTTTVVDLVKETVSCNFTQHIPVNCTHFLMCTDNIIEEMICPSDFVFSEEKNDCVNPNEVPECDIKVFNVTEFNLTSNFTEPSLIMNLTHVPHKHIHKHNKGANATSEESTESAETESSEEHMNITTQEKSVLEQFGHWKNWKHN